ncbi:MAG: DUF116 domain-containing protein [Candidatus Cloacimonadaceae bacterium]|jgi:hypothetical protein|nr:DUF116 domain-containing protein [Candidatus Cloacimonadota bacterium]MDX9950327.1 DUF116 domain-containing protein [Candidatus Syntrophosphaera sp.]
MKNQDNYLSVIKFPAFVSLSLLIIGAIYSILVYYLLQRPATVSYLIRGLMIALLVVIVFTVLSWVLALMSTHIRIKCPYLNRFNKWMLSFVFYPLSRVLGTITFSHPETLTESFLNFNNEVVMTDQRDVRNSNILVLLPHCLQKDDCTVRVTADIMNCEECGGCDIATVKKLITQQNVKSAIATGGSLARKLIEDNKPDVIVAVACHRDLLEGLRDAWSYPVYAVLNERPKGPCHETTVSIASIEFAIQRFK